VVVQDLDSKNGTFIDGSRISTRTLRGSEVIRIGPNVSVRFALTTDSEERLARELYDSSMKDPLTRAYNRRYFMNRLKAELAFATRHKAVLSVVMFDLDHFKAVNDAHGHAAGDAVLRNVSAVAERTLRSEDVLARFGGEEFVCLLRGIDLAAATRCAERLREAIAGSSVTQDGRVLKATISAGVADCSELAVPTPTGLVDVADRRLYQAKSSGRNRVCGA
jgi:diguanylate cyclase (GGDEF)-like protein